MFRRCHTNLPFLMVFLPRSGSRTGSTFSGRFSIRTVSPQARARSITSRYLLKEDKGFFFSFLTKSKKNIEFNTSSPRLARHAATATDSGPSPALCQLHHPQLRAQTLPQPLDALLLWVHHERPTLAGGQDGGVLDGHPIVWQTLVVPGSHCGVICKHEDGVQAVCQGHRGLEQTGGRCQ